MSTRTMYQVVDLLNWCLEREPKAISDLFRNRVQFTDREIADHSTIQVGVVEGRGDLFDLGFLGLLNGIFGTDTDRLAIMVDDPDAFYDGTELIQRFRAYDDYGNRGKREGQ